MTPLEALRDALKEIALDDALDALSMDAPDDDYVDDVAKALIEALHQRRVILVHVAPEVAPYFIQTRDSGK